MAPNATPEREEPASLSVTPSPPPDPSTAPGGQHNSFYRSGGTLSADEPSYVVRDADEQLLQGLREGLFCYMLTSRQMGKSSLMNRVAAQLQQEGVAVAQIDLTTIGQNLTIEQWYDGLVYEVGRRLKIRQQVNKCWADHAELGPLHRFAAVLREGVLNTIPGNVVIFVDEIDLVRSLPFSTDEFFAAIRECYNRRSSDPEMNRLTFCLLGMATPQDLIRDPRITPFNIGRRIELRDFTLREALQLAQGVQTDGRDGVRLLSRIIYWTNGHPYITQKVCEAVATNTTIRDENGVDQLCSKLFLSQQARETEANLVPVREYILRSKEERVPALELYQKVRRGAKIAFDNTDPVANLLQLSGITRVQSGRLVVRNRIYEQVFDIPWVMSELPEAEVRRQKALVIRGRIQIASIAIPILLVFIALAGEAFQQAHLARESELQTKRALYISDMRLAGDSLDNDNASDTLNLLSRHKNEDIAGFEYPYLWTQCHLTDSVCIGHTKPITNIAFDPFKRYLVTAGNDSTMRFWDYNTGRQIGQINSNSDPAVTLAVSPDGKYLAAGFLSGRLQIFAADTWKLMTSIPIGGLTSLAFSPDSRTLAAGALDKIELIDTQHWVSRSSISVGGFVYSLRFNPKHGQQLAFGHVDGAVTVMDVRNNSTAHEFTDLRSNVRDIAFSRDGRLLAAGSAGGNAAVWDDVTGVRKQLIYNRRQDIFCVRFAPTTPDLITAGADATIKYWSLNTGQLVHALHGHTGKIQGMDISNDGRRLATASWDQTAMVWDTSLRTRDSLMLANRPPPSWFPIMSPDSHLVAGIMKDGRLGVWSTTTGKRVCSIPASAGESSVLAFVPNSDVLAVASSTLKFWNTRTSTETRATKIPRLALVRSFAMSPDGTRIALLPNDRVDEVPQMIDIGSNNVTELAVSVHNSWSSIAFSGNGRHIALGAVDGTIVICDSRNGKLLTSFASGLRGLVSSMAFSPNERSFAAASSYDALKVWNLGDIYDPNGGRKYEVLTLSIPTSNLRSIAFNDNGTVLRAVDNQGYITSWRATGDK